MPITRYYPISSSTSRGPLEPASEQSTAFPWGTEGTTYSAGPRFYALGTAPVSGGFFSQTTYNSLPQTARQSQFVAHFYYELGAQTIPAGNWSFAPEPSQSSAAANRYSGVAIYVWRPSTNTKVGTIYDSQTQLGVEYAASTQSRLFTVSGASVTTEDGDVLIAELWSTAQQSMGTAYFQALTFSASEGIGDFTANNQSGLNSWIDAPEELQPPSGPIDVLSQTGAGIYTGLEPTVTASANQAIDTATGEGSYAGLVAAILLPILVATGAGQGTWTGYEPSVAVTNNTVVVTDTGSGSYAGLAPAILTPVSVETGTGSVLATGFAPTAAVATFAATQTGAVTATGFAPLALTPAVALPGSGSVLATGQAPTVTASDNVAIATATGTGSYTGLTPAIVLPVAVPTATGAGIYAGQAPAVVLGNNVISQPGSGSAILTGYAPTVETSQSIEPGTGQGVWSGLAPDVRLAVIVTPGTGTVTATGFAPVLNENLVVATGTGSATYTGLVPGIATPILVGPGTGQVEATGYAPIVGVAVIVSTATGTGTYSGLAPIVAVTDNVFAATGTGAVEAIGLAPFIVNPKTADPGTGLVNATGYAPLVGIITRAQGRDSSAPYVELVEQSLAAVDPWDIADVAVRLSEESAPDYGARDRSGADVAVLDSSQGRP